MLSGGQDFGIVFSTPEASCCTKLFITLENMCSGFSPLVHVWAPRVRERTPPTLRATDVRRPQVVFTRDGSHVDERESGLVAMRGGGREARAAISRAALDETMGVRELASLAPPSLEGVEDMCR